MANSDFLKFRKDAQPRSAVYSDNNSTINAWLKASKMPADNITYTPGTGMSATNAQTALNELATEKMDKLGQNGIPAPTANDILITDGNGQAQDSKKKFITTITSNPSDANILTEKGFKDYIDARFASFSDYQGTFNYFAQSTVLDDAKTAVEDAANKHGAVSGNTAVAAKTNVSLKPTLGDVQKGTFNGTAWTWTDIPLKNLTNGDWIYVLSLVSKPITGTTRYRSGRAILKIDGTNNTVFDEIPDNEVSPDGDTLDYNGLGAIHVKNQTFEISENTDKFVSGAELSFKGFWQQVLNKINGLIQKCISLDSNKVSKAGDTMTGALTVETSLTVKDGTKGTTILKQEGTSLQVYNSTAGTTDLAIQVKDTNDVVLKDGASSATKGLFLTVSDKGSVNGVAPLVNGKIPVQYVEAASISYTTQSVDNFNSFNSTGRWFVNTVKDVTANPPLNITGSWFIEIGSDTSGNNLLVVATLSGTPGHRLFRTSSDNGATWSAWQYPYALYNPGL